MLSLIFNIYIKDNKSFNNLKLIRAFTITMVTTRMRFISLNVCMILKV